jgi:hypothetical protein
LFALIAVFCVSFALGSDDDNALKCITKHLKDKGINEEFLSSVGTSIDSGVNCNDHIEAKLAKGFGKIRDKLDADTYFRKYSDCIMKAINTETNRNLVLRREAIKINGVGVKVWNYFNQREHLDELKKEIESSINKAANEQCIR